MRNFTLFSALIIQAYLLESHVRHPLCVAELSTAKQTEQ